MIRNAFPYIPMLRALGEFNLPLIELFRKVGMPTKLKHAVTLGGGFRCIEITYDFYEGDKDSGYRIRDYFLRFRMNGEVVKAYAGTMWTGESSLREQEKLAGSYEVYLRAFVTRRNGWRKRNFNPEGMALFIRETEDLFDYPEGYVDLFRERLP